MKSSRRRNKLALSARELESLVQEILYRMDQAWAADEAASAAGKPGLEKVLLMVLNFCIMWYTYRLKC